MVRIGLLKTAREPEPECDETMLDEETDDTFTQTSDSEHECAMPHIQDVRAIPFVDSSLLVEPTPAKPLPELLMDASSRSDTHTPWNIDMLKTSALQPPTPSLVLQPPVLQAKEEPIVLKTVTPELSTALSKLKTHPNKASVPELAFGLSYNAAWQPRGALTQPSCAQVAPCGQSTLTPVGGLTTVNIMSIKSTLQPLSVLASRSQQAADGQITFNLLSTPPPSLPVHLLSSVLDALSQGFESPACPVGNTSSYIHYNGTEHAAATVQLIKALWGNDERDDVEGLPGTSGLTSSYEEMNRRRRLHEWLRKTSAAVPCSLPESVALCVNGRRSHAASAARKSGKSGEAALLLSACNSTRVQALVGRAEGKSALMDLSALNSTTPDDCTWKQAFHHVLQLSDTTANPHVEELAKKSLKDKTCPPPYHEALKGSQATDAALQEVLANGATKRDICWHILQLWSGNSEGDFTAALFDPLTWKHSYTDYSLNWMVCLLLSVSPSINVSLPTERVNDLTIAYADQLLREQQWRWGLFVLFTLPDHQTRKARVVGALANVLVRHERETPFAQGLSLGLASNPSIGVPPEWLAEAKNLVTPVPQQPVRRNPSPMPLANEYKLEAETNKLLDGLF